MTGSTARLIVYTAITRGYDALKVQPHADSNAAEFVAFLGEPCESPTWRSYPIHTGFADPTRNAKIHKVLSHQYFPDAEYTLWIDGSVTIINPAPMARLIDLCLAEHDLAVFQHRRRTCVYQEATVCLEQQLDDPETIWQQICRYTAAGVPPNAGLGECCVVLRRHTAAVRAFNEAWWAEICAGSRRDQLSFDHVARTLGLRYATFPGTIAANAWFRRVPHAQPRATAAGAPAAAPAAHYRSRPRTQPRKTLAFGAIRHVPSWSWAGLEVARALSKDYDVVLYERDATPPPCDVLFLVKHRPTAEFLEVAERRGVPIVYCPIDAYHATEEIGADRALLARCAAVLTHSERLIPLLRPYCAATHFVEHYTRYALPEMTEFKPDGFILWVGHVQHVPYLLHWLAAHPIDGDVRILTDLDNPRGWEKARANAAALGLAMQWREGPLTVNGYSTHVWSERRQQELFRACKAALDVKHTALFNQFHKPPTKAQQYVASGVPCAVNAESYSAEYFRRRGFVVASPDEPARWLSRDYWEATRAFGAALRRDTSLEVVAARYRQCIETL